MATVGIICEYNPLHRGHAHQIEVIRRSFGADTRIVCCMSGNFVQRGAPAIFDKTIRAKAAIAAGADLVAELPIGAALSSAEGFAAGGVAVLSNCCDAVSFGVESMDAAELWGAAKVLLSPEFPPLLKQALETGLSFPAARQRALEAMGVRCPGLQLPNNILAVEYCKAILNQGADIQIFPIRREGDYHAETLGDGFPSATAVRRAILNGESWTDALPKQTQSIFENAPQHCLAAGERAILGKLRIMTDAEFEALPYGSEGLWRKLMKASRKEATLEAIIEATKSKRYTRSRIDRMILCAFLGLTEEALHSPAPYVRVLAFNDRGRSILKEQPEFRNAGEAIDHPYWDLERRCGNLYGLFCSDDIAPPQTEEKRRVIYGHL